MILAANQKTGLGVRLDVEIDRVNYESKVSVLINAVHFFLEDVIIIKADEGFILAVIHQEKIFHYKRYGTAKGARIAFKRLYGYKGYEKKVNTKWTPFYVPEKGWIENKLNAETMAKIEEK